MLGLHGLVTSSESLTVDLNKAADFLEEGQKNGNLQKFWDAKEVKDELTKLRQDIINNFQLKLFVTSLEVRIDSFFSYRGSFGPNLLLDVFRVQLMESSLRLIDDITRRANMSSTFTWLVRHRSQTGVESRMNFRHSLHSD